MSARKNESAFITFSSAQSDRKMLAAAALTDVADVAVELNTASSSKVVGVEQELSTILSNYVLSVSISHLSSSIQSFKL